MSIHDAVYGGGSYVSGSSGNASGAVNAIDPRDHGRTYLPQNGGCIYIDLDHIELCLPEVRSAHDHVACWHAMLRILREALDTANSRLFDSRLHVLVNNSDGCEHSYGSHLNFLVTETCWRNVFERKMHYMLYLAAYQVSSIVFTGQGKVGSENRTPAVDFQLSQRADFFEQLTGPHTTFSRPIVNSREEALCGYGVDRRAAGAHDLARLHVIFYDSTLCHVATLLKIGVMQIILAMIEAERVNPLLALEDPVRALHKWSHDPTLKTVQPLCSGEEVTAVELQRRFLDDASRFVASGACEGIVPHASEIVDLWADTLDKLETMDMDVLSRRLDWALKYSTLDRVRRERHLDWKDPALKQLDHLYSSLDAKEGLFWALERDGCTEKLVSNADIERFIHEPPDDTRAWTRAMLMRRAGTERIASIDWDRIRFTTSQSWYQCEHRTLELANPLGLTKVHAESILRSKAPLTRVIDALERKATTHKEATHEYTTKRS
jgi:proteasome accessory factor A